MKILMIVVVVVMVLIVFVFVGGYVVWKFVGDESLIVFGFVKKDVVGEVYIFGDVFGMVSEGGDVVIVIQLVFVEINIDICNECMIEYVFKGMDVVVNLIGFVDMDDVNDLVVGVIIVIDFEGILSFVGVFLDIEIEFFVVCLFEDCVLVIIFDFLMLFIVDIGVNVGVDKLMELVKLSGIICVSLVIVCMVFEK